MTTDEEILGTLFSEEKPVDLADQLDFSGSSSYSFEHYKESLPYKSLVDAAEAKHGIPKNLLSRLIQQESRFNPYAVSPKGARGIMQIMPEEHPTADPDNPRTAIDYGAGYLKQLYNQFGNWNTALAAYNAGPGRVAKGGQLPPETIDYVNRVGGGNGTGMQLASDDSILNQLFPTAPQSTVQPAAQTIGQLAKPLGRWNEAGQALNEQGVPYPLTDPFTGKGTSNKAFFNVFGIPILLGSVADIKQRATSSGGGSNAPKTSLTKSIFKGIVSMPITAVNTIAGALSWPIPLVAGIATYIDRLIERGDPDYAKFYADLTAKEISKWMPRLPNTEEGMLQEEVLLSPLGWPKALSLWAADVTKLKELLPKIPGKTGQVIDYMADQIGDFLSAMMAMGGVAKAPAAIKAGAEFLNRKAVKKDLSVRGKEVSEIKGEVPEDSIERAQAKIDEIKFSEVSREAWTAQSILNREIVSKNIAEQKAAGIVEKPVIEKPVVEKVDVSNPDGTFTSKKGTKYFKVGETWYSNDGIEIKNQFILKAAEKSLVPKEVKPEAIPDYQAEADKLGIVFNGLQETPDGKSIPLFTDHNTGSTFTTKKGQTITDALAEIRSKFVPELTEDAMAKHLETVGYNKVDAAKMAKYDWESKTLDELDLDIPDGKGGWSNKPVTNIAEYAKYLRDLDVDKTPGKKRAEPYTEIDEHIGTPAPEGLSTHKSPFRDSNAEHTNAMGEAYKEKMQSIRSDPETLTSYLINEVNRYLNGEEVDIGVVKDQLSEMAARSKELRGMFEASDDFASWNKTVNEAADWARKSDRLKIEPTSDTKLFSGIPIDEVSKKFKDLLDRISNTRYFKDFNELGDATRALVRSDARKQFEGKLSKSDEIENKISILEDKLDKANNADSPNDALISKIENQIGDLNKQLDSTVGEKLYSGLPLSEVVRLAEKFLKTVWHGGPDDLTKTGIKSMMEAQRKGTGGAMEGAGFYVGESPKVGEYYAKMAKKQDWNHQSWFNSSNSKIDSELKKISGTLYNLGWDFGTDQNISIQENIASFKTSLKITIENSIESIKRSKQGLRGVAISPVRESLGDVIKEKRHLVRDLTDIYNKLSSYTPEELSTVTVGGKSYLHKMNIPVDKMNWLEWDKPVSEENINKIASALSIDPRYLKGEYIPKGNWMDVGRGTMKQPTVTGKEFYSRLELKLGSKEEVSRILAEQDIDGMKYPAADPITGKRYAGPQSNYVIYDPVKWIDPEKNISMVGLYSGIPPSEAAKAILDLGAAAGRALNKMSDPSRVKISEVAKAVKTELTRSWVDRSGNIRRELLSQLGDVGYKILQKATLVRGANSISANYLERLKKEVYGGLPRDEKGILDKVLLTDRIVAIAKSAKGKKFNYPKGLNPQESAVYSELFGMKSINHIKDLTPETVAKIRKRVEIYKEWMKKPLNDRLEAGIISQKEYDDLIVHDYRRIRTVDNTVKIFDVVDREIPSLKKRGISVYDSGIQALKLGKETDIFELSGEVMALETFNRTYGRIMNNRANLELLGLAHSQPDNNFARVRYKKEELNERATQLRTKLEAEGVDPKKVNIEVNKLVEKNDIPAGWKKISVYEDGKKKTIHISPLMAEEWITSGPEISYKAAQQLRWFSGAPIVRTFATGINWAFAVANLPRDVMHIWSSARGFEDGKWKPIYNSNAPIYTLQMGRDLASVFNDTILRKGRYQKYIEEGGGMETLARQGRLFQQGRHIGGKGQAVMDLLGYIGETSELLTRLAIHERALRQGKSAAEATFIARDYMDFGQGGGVAKAADNAFTYTNAILQATRGMARAIKENPVSASYKIVQLTAATTGIYIAATYNAPNTMRDLKGNVNMQNNLCIPMGDDFGWEDEKGQMRYPYFKFPLDSFQKFFKTVAEGAVDKWLGNDVDVDRITGSLKQLSPVDVSPLFPSVSGILGYISNKDFWLNEDIWKKSSKSYNWQLPKRFTGKEIGGSEEENILGQTPQALTDFGSFTGFSPERFKYLAEQIITRDNFFAGMLGKAYDTVFSDLPKKEKQFHLFDALSKFPLTKRFIGVTNPYSRFAGPIERAAEESEAKRVQQTLGLDMRVDGHLYYGNTSSSEVMGYINGFKERDVQERLKERFKFQTDIKDLPNRSFWLRLQGLSTDARAKVYLDRLDGANEEERAQLRKEEGIVRHAGGIFTEDFQRDVMRLRENR